jgi:phenylalanyl-tRNA synthetase beta chain
LPRQHKSVAGAFVGSLDDVNALFRKAKGVIEALPRYVHAQEISFAMDEKPVWADNVLWLNILSGNSDAGDSDIRNSDAGKKQVGSLALLSRKAALDCGIKNSAVMLFEMNMDELIPLTSRTNRFTHLPEYPMTDYDVSMLFSRDTKWEEILSVITSKKSADELLRGVSFVDEYRGRQVPDERKSVTFRLVIGSLSKTLTAEEIETCAAAIVKRLGKTLGAELRN